MVQIFMQYSVLLRTLGFYKMQQVALHRIYYSPRQRRDYSQNS